MQNQEYSLLRAAGVRPYWMALAHCFMTAKPGSDRMVFLNQQFTDHLSIADKLRCRGELRMCRAAIRGETLAEVCS